MIEKITLGGGGCPSSRLDNCMPGMQVSGIPWWVILVCVAALVIVVFLVDRWAEARTRRDRGTVLAVTLAFLILAAAPVLTWHHFKLPSIAGSGGAVCSLYGALVLSDGYSKSQAEEWQERIKERFREDSYCHTPDFRIVNVARLGPHALSREEPGDYSANTGP